MRGTVPPIRLTTHHLRRHQFRSGINALAGVGLVSVLAATAPAATINFTANGTYTGTPVTRDGVVLVTGATASQAYTLDTVTKTGTAIETIISGANTYQFTANNMNVSGIGPAAFSTWGSGTSPHGFGFGLTRPINAPTLQSDLSNLSEYFSAFNSAGANGTPTALFATDNSPDFRLDSVVVPEPMSFALLAIGGSVLALRRREMAVA